MEGIVKMSNKSKIDMRSLIGTEKLQYAFDNFAGIVTQVEYLRDNFELIKNYPQGLLMLAFTGYYVSLGSLIKNRQGMDYTKIFELWEIALDKNKIYCKLNEGLKHNITVLKEWEESLEYEMKHVITIRDKYFAHIDFVDKDFLINSFILKDVTKQNDLIKFFRCLIETSNDYFGSICREFN